MRSKLSIILYLSLVFLSGVLVGVVGHRLYNAQVVNGKPPSRPSPEEFRKRYMTDMRSRLKLTDQQAQQIETILDETRDRFRAESRAMQEQQRERIRAILQPEQQREYEKMLREREERRKKSGPPRC